ncbi:hypothetical protein Sango_0009900 [Sesamum angolense]|uniref:Uncharacterized protein n=1 Tax=Sesamum angolense TaxID=2727404 RepID=A0AAE2C538_9LAMI|nr:hypothetical protein Sango_0009900 [Sesamum angolense]
MYAMHCSRPDIAFVVCNPSIEHWKGIRRVFGYLKGIANLGFLYNIFPAVLESYSDASWITSIGNNKSTSGWSCILVGGAVAWASKKQNLFNTFYNGSRICCIGSNKQRG